MPTERQQFRVLFRAFLRNTIDLELLSSGGDTRDLIGQLAAILAAFNFVVAIMIVPRYGTSGLPSQVLRTNAWGDEEFLISSTLSVVGIVMVLAWDALIPDLRDALVLGVLPIRTRTVALAKLAALGTLVAGSVVLLNVFTGVCFPFFAADSTQPLGLLRCLVSYWITMGAAGLFVACLMLTVQGLAMHVLSYKRFLRCSSYIQLSVIFLILAVFFLKPPLATVSSLSAPQNQRWLACLPSYWFLGIFQELNGTMSPVFRPLAIRGAWGLLICTGSCFVAFFLSYRWNTRRMLEQPDITPTDRIRPFQRIGSVAVTTLLRTSLDRAIVLFTARTLARSRKHRLILALYGGIGFAVALVFAGSLFRGDSKWNYPSPPLLTASLVILFFGILGARMVVTMPFALPSNWVFRITAVETSVHYFSAVRRSFYLIIVLPIWSAFAFLYLTIWPLRLAAQHLAILAVVGVLITEKSLQGFRKIPFTCSYLPGRANLKVTLGFYGSVILFLAYTGGQIEFLLMNRPIGYSVQLGILLAAAILGWRRRTHLANSAYTPVQFEDLPISSLELLDLEREGDVLGAER